MTEEAKFYWSAMLGEIYQAQWRSEKAITAFQESLQHWKENVSTMGRARVMGSLVNSLHMKLIDNNQVIKALDRNQNINPSDIAKLSEATEEYLQFCGLHHQKFLLDDVVGFLGDVLRGCLKSRDRGKKSSSGIGWNYSHSNAEELCLYPIPVI